MYNESDFSKHDVLCVDMKSFYASVECVMRGLDPMSTKLAVVGDIHRNGSVVLASSPQLKKEHHIKTGSRLFEIKNINDPSIIIAQARMETYIKFSEFIKEIYEQFVPPNAIHVYSVDESWLTLDGTEKLWGNRLEAARKIRSEIFHLTGLFATIGIGDNKFLAKAVLDIHAKKRGIAECRIEDIKQILHPVDVGEMWGVGSRMKLHFNHLGIFTIGDLASYDVSLLKDRFGVIGEQLHMFANGFDPSPVFYDKDHPPQAVFGFGQNDSFTPVKSVGRGVTLLKDYTKKEEILLVIRELVEEVCEVLRDKKVVGKTIHLSIGYSKTVNERGFSRQKSSFFTNDVVDIFTICRELYNRFSVPYAPVRSVRVSVGKLDEEKNHPSIDYEHDKRKRLSLAKDFLNQKFGKGTIRIADSFSENSVAKDRLGKINGHKK